MNGALFIPQKSAINCIEHPFHPYVHILASVVVLFLLLFVIIIIFFSSFIIFIYYYPYYSFIQIFLDFSSVRGDYIDHSRQHHQICIFLGVLISNSTLPIIFFQQKKHILNKFSIKLNRNVLFNFLMGFQSLL